MIQVFIVDDHPVVVDSLERLLAGEDDLEFVGACHTGEEFIRLLPQVRCDVVILDHVLPDMNGGGVLRAIRQFRPDLTVLFFTMQPMDQYAGELLKAGAAGFVSKSLPTTDLLEAIRNVVTGERFVASEKTPSRATSLSGEEEIACSQRERAILAGLVAGESMAAIGKRLTVSKSSVATYINRLRRKLGANTIEELCLIAVKRKLL